MNTERHHTSHGAQPLSLDKEAPDFYAYVESNPTPILITDAKAEIQYVNAGWQRLTGYAWHEVVGKNPRFLNSGSTPDRVYEELWASLARGEPYESDEFVNQRKDGSEYSLHAVFFPVQLRKNTPYFAQVVYDITDRKEIEKQKDSFINIASHELRDPLSTMVFSLDLLKHELGNAPQEAEKTLGTLSSAMERFRSLMAYLLDVNRIQSDALRVHRERKNLKDLVERVVAEMRVTYPSHTLVLETACPHPFASFDEGRIAQVLANLISNAVKYSPGADRVIIRLVEEAGFLKVSVQDFGIGIPKEEQKKVFEMLYRAKNKGAIQGAGLGLYIATQIIAAHGARLSLVSEEGTGSTFYFSLPVVF